MTKYEDHDWKELPEDVKAAAKKLGYTKKMWDGDQEPKICDEYWDDLTEEQQAAATTIGYDKETWNKEDGATCCTIS